MNLSNAQTTPPAGGPGVLLRHWRDLRRKSQIELSLDTGISQRHISFIESGRSNPSRQTLQDIAQALDIPLRERNVILLAAGYAPIYSEAAWNAEEMHGVTRALERMLRLHDPFPAIVMDRYWNVLMTNDSAPRFFGSFIDMSSRKSPRNMLHLLFDPNGLRPFVANWAAVAKSLIERVLRESVGHISDEGTKELLAQLHAYPDVAPGWSCQPSPKFSPMLPFTSLSFVKEGHVLNYFSMVTTVGAPQMIAAQELRVECMFPADDATEKYHEDLMAT
jgi:transcriptional regulator with XRE-family HTH domain